jgi:hypothetical protein
MSSSLVLAEGDWPVAGEDAHALSVQHGMLPVQLLDTSENMSENMSEDMKKHMAENMSQNLLHQLSENVLQNTGGSARASASRDAVIEISSGCGAPTRVSTNLAALEAEAGVSRTVAEMMTRVGISGSERRERFITSTEGAIIATPRLARERERERARLAAAQTHQRRGPHPTPRVDSHLISQEGPVFASSISAPGEPKHARDGHKSLDAQMRQFVPIDIGAATTPAQLSPPPTTAASRAARAAYSLHASCSQLRGVSPQVIPHTFQALQGFGSLSYREPTPRNAVSFPQVRAVYLSITHTHTHTLSLSLSLSLSSSINLQYDSAE